MRNATDITNIAIILLGTAIIVTYFDYLRTLRESKRERDRANRKKLWHESKFKNKDEENRRGEYIDY